MSDFVDTDNLKIDMSIHKPGSSKVNIWSQNHILVKIDSSPLVRFYQNLNGLEKVYVYFPRKSAKYSDHSSRIVPRGLSVAEGP